MEPGVAIPRSEGYRTNTTVEAAAVPHRAVRKKKTGRRSASTARAPRIVDSSETQSPWLLSRIDRQVEHAAEADVVKLAVRGGHWSGHRRGISESYRRRSRPRMTF